jgi:hypothetical protein
VKQIIELIFSTKMVYINSHPESESCAAPVLDFPVADIACMNSHPESKSCAAPVLDFLLLTLPAVSKSCAAPVLDFSLPA